MNGVKPAARVAAVIGVFKWVVIAFVILSGIGGAWTAMSGKDTVDLETGFPKHEDGSVALGLFYLFGAVIVAIAVWVFYGWLQNVLRMLVTIARNTERVEVPYQTLPVQVGQGSLHSQEPMPPAWVNEKGPGAGPGDTGTVSERGDDRSDRPGPRGIR